MAGRGRPKKANGSNNGANLVFEDKMWLAADELRGQDDAAEYKHVDLGLVFLKYISDAFEEHHSQLLKEHPDEAEDRDAYRVSAELRGSHPGRVQGPTDRPNSQCDTPSGGRATGSS